MKENKTIKYLDIEPAKVPVVDFQQLKSTNLEKHQLALGQLDKAFQEFGFVYICNHTIEKKQLDLAFEWSRRFFALSPITKALISQQDSGRFEDLLGWSKFGEDETQHVKVYSDVGVENDRQLDHKETLEIGNPTSKSIPPNPWLPERELPGFRNFVENWWTACAGLANDLLESLGETLNAQNKDCLSVIHTNHDVCHLTWNYYESKPLHTSQNLSFNRLGAHTDLGTMTLVFQDMVGGLEVHDGTEFRPIMPIPGTVIVNIGDMLEQQSNGRWKSALHRVVAPGHFMKSADNNCTENQDQHVDRYSLVWFAAPNPDETIRILPGCEEPGKWKPKMHDSKGMVSAREWIERRLAVGA